MRKKPADQSADRGDQMMALHELTLQTSAVRSVDEFISAAISQIAKAVAPDLIFFFLIENNELILKKSWQHQKDESSIAHESGELGVCLCGLAVAGVEPVYSIDIHKDARCTRGECKMAGVRSLAALPLQDRNDRVLGLICTGSFTKRDFRKDATFIEILSSHVAISLSNMLIFEELQRKNDSLLLLAESNEIAGEKIRQLNRVYALLSNVNQAIIRLRDKQQLFDEICRIAVEDGKFRMAWIGEVEENRTLVRIAARCGSTGDYLDDIRISISDVPEGQGPVGRAIRSGTHVVSSDIEHDENMRPWRSNALRNGFRSLASFPITVSGRTIGAFNLYSSEVGFFTDQEVVLLDELADDISFSLQFIAAEKALHESEERLTAIFDTANEGILLADPETKIFHFANKMICRMLGYSLAEINGLGIVNIHPEEDLPHVIEQFERQAKKEIALAENIPVKRKDGTIFYADINSSPLIVGGKTYIAGFFTDTTERRKSQAALQESELRFRSLMQTAGDAVIMSDAAGNIISWNNGAKKIFGYEEYEVINKPLTVLMPERYRERHTAGMKRFLSGKQSEYLGRIMDFHGTKKDGTEFPLELSVNALPSVRGTYFLGIIRDVSEQNLIKASLEEQKSFAEGIIENSTVATFVVASDHKVIRWNKACEELTGMSAAEMIGSDNHWKPFYPEKRPTLCDVVMKGNLNDLSSLYEKYSRSPLIASGLRSEGWYSNLNGKDRYIIFDAAPIFGSNDSLLYAIETLQDMTAQKETEKALEDHLHFLQKLIDSIPNPIFYKDREGRYIGCNKAFEAYLGRERDELIGKTVFDIFPRDLAEIYHKADEQLFMNPGIQTYEAAVQYADGSRHDVIFYKATFVAPDGATSGLIGTILDITDRKHLEDALRESEVRVKTIIDTEPHCVKLVSQNGTLIEMNPAGLAMIEAESLDQVKGQSMLSIILPEHQKAFKEHVSMIFRGASGKIDFEIIGLKGTHRWLQTHSVPFRNSKGEIVALLGITRDITEQRNIEEQLRHAQKLEGIGQLAGGIAHDFNNILNAVVGFGSLAQMNIDSPSRLKEYLAEVVAAGQRGASLTRQLLAFSRKQTLDMKQVKLNALIADLMKMLHRLIREDINLSFAPATCDLFIKADSSQIDQVIINLVTNARDAIQHNGEITITAEPVFIDSDFINMHGFGAVGQYALICISDTGSGMDRQTIDRIFEPFFTTKELGKGTGLGLAVVYGIIRQHNGFINVYSELGKGSTFKIYLPVTASSVDTAKKTEMVRPSGGTEAILIADDDRSIRNLLRTLLTQAGYTVITAEDGADAVTKFRENRDAISLMILDAIMPNKNGQEAYEEISSSAPGVKTIFLSGYAKDIINHNVLAEKEISFLTKPILPNDLLKKIREVLDR